MRTIITPYVRARVRFVTFMYDQNAVQNAMERMYVLRTFKGKICGTKVCDPYKETHEFLCYRWLCIINAGIKKKRKKNRSPVSQAQISLFLKTKKKTSGLKLILLHYSRLELNISIVLIILIKLNYSKWECRNSAG